MCRRGNPAVAILIALLALVPTRTQAASVTSVEFCETVTEPEMTCQDVAERFSLATPEIHAVVKLEVAEPAIRLRGAWVAVDAIDIPNYEIASSELEVFEDSGAIAHFSLTKPNRDWPAGNYRLDVYAQGQLIGSNSFVVRAEAGARSSASAPKAKEERVEDGVRKKLQALDAAYQAGILSEQEYAAKRADLEAQRRASSATLDAVTHEKLEALDKARKAGVLSEEEYARKRVALERGQPATPVKAGSLPSSSHGRAGERADRRRLASAKGRTYRHVVGFSFWYPADWTVKEHDDFLQIVPPEVASTPEGPSEIFFIIGESVAGEGIYTPDDFRVLSYLDTQVQSVSPTLQRVGGVAFAEMANGQGVVMNWQGANAKGQTVRARAYVSILNEHGVALLAIGLDDRIGARDTTLRRMFASFGFGRGQLDPRLTGSWSFLTTRSMTNWSPYETDYSRAQMASESSAVLVFRPDGTWMRTDNSYMIAGGAGVWLESNDKSVSRGRWNAGSGSLYMIWEDNSWEDYSYEIRQSQEGQQLLLVSGNRGELWQRNE